MKQPEDSRTIELNLVNAKDPKRGRGRPPKADALTPAERAKRYRDAKRIAGIPRTPANQHEAEFQFDYTRPTWEQHDEELEELRSQIRNLTSQLEASKKENEGLRKEQTLLIEERQTAFNAHDLAKAELERLQRKTTTTGKLASQVLELEAEKAQLIQDKATIAAQGAALVDKVRELEVKLKKRDASRKRPAL